MSKVNGHLAIAIPLYRRHEMDDTTLPSPDATYRIKMICEEDKPIAYVIDVGYARQLVNYVFAHDNLEFLGDL
jgi:hypothetical protein